MTNFTCKREPLLLQFYSKITLTIPFYEMLKENILFKNIMVQNHYLTAVKLCTESFKEILGSQIGNESQKENVLIQNHNFCSC